MVLGVMMFIYGQWRSIIQFGNNWVERSYVVMFAALCCFVAAAVINSRK